MKLYNPSTFAVTFFGCLVLCLIACAEYAAAAESASTMHLEVDAREISRKLLHAREEIPVQPGKLALWYPKWMPGTHAPGGPVQNTGHVGILHELDRLFSLRSGTLREVGWALVAYGLLEGIESVGLWLTKRWAEYLTFLATTILLPLEVYEIVHRRSALKIIGFLINLAIVIYLLFAKRLFGLRGGGAAEEAKRASDMSWEAIERATPGG